MNTNMNANKLIVMLLPLIISSTVLAQVAYRYEGFIEVSQAKKLPITVKLTVQGSQFTGSYYYTNNGEPLNLAGTIIQQANKQFELRETNAKNSVTGYFIGNWDEKESIISGKWQTLDRKKTYKFVWKKVTPIPYDIISKSEIKEQSKGSSKAVKSYTIPQIKNHPDANLQNKFNQAMAALKPEMSIDDTEIGNNLYTNITTTVISATDEFVSYQTVRSQTGESTTTQDLYAFATFDLKKGDVIYLSDILKPGINADKWLAPHKEKWVKETAIDYEGSWSLVLTDNTLQMMFTDMGNSINYDVLTYQPIILLYSQIKDDINPDSALGRWLAKK
ncbi:hypothetical protein [Thermoflexibacter ruber]|uniref:DUF3298 domain-containing protein n=1 Tax=Thermoflexibacter ruber TaxID=1003 RepID=A0A1I2IG00_9BACT|nr:hypothetical protein [Thermoflexibacter ruber]SFF41302.1 hypothetical protein SAMN04488541_103217 [Thermoflexibacter ruber]